MRGWVNLAVAALALAGCSGSGGAASTPEAGLSSEEIDNAVRDVPVAASATTGVIRGVVVDQAIRPIAGATVAVAGFGSETVSNDQGAFGFEGLQPGTYFVTASKEGYEPSQTSVDVEAGVADPSAVRIRLAARPFQLAYCNVLHQRGAVGFAVTDPLGDRLTTFNPLNPDGSFRASADLDANLTWTQTEVVWTPNLPTADRFWVDFYLFTEDDTIDSFKIEGGSPIIALFDGAAISETSAAMTSGLTVWAGRMQPQPGVNGPGVMADQTYDAYFIACYHWTPPLGYTFYADGEPKPPQQTPPASGSPPLSRANTLWPPPLVALNG